MNKLIVKCIFLAFAFSLTVNVVDAQAKKPRTAKKRAPTTKKTRNTVGTTAAPAKLDTVAVALPGIDSLPLSVPKKSLRSNDAIQRNLVTERTPLAYDNIREDDAVYRERLWREIDIREKQNMAFRYTADEDNGNQRFISILFKAIQDGQDNGGVTVFDAVDDRFTTPLTVSQVARKISGDPVDVPVYDSVGNITSYKKTTPEVSLDSFYKFRIKEEVIFDKQSSRLFWRILGIAPIKMFYTSQGVPVGESEIFWVYYPDMRPILIKYDVYNGKNFGARMTWEELFESRMFYGRIVKSTLDNPGDKYLSEFQGLKDNKILQLFEGEDIKDRIFNYEQNLWSY